MWKRKPAERKTKELPTNIEDANREYVRNRMASWDERILTERAARLGVTPEAALLLEAKPLYLVEAEKRAETEGRSLESVLDEFRERLTRSSYPGPNCFLPDDILEYADGALSADRLVHAETCAACATLLESSRSLERAEKEIREAIRQRVDPDLVPEPVFAAAPASSGRRRWVSVMENWAAVVLLPALVLLGAYIYFWRVDSSATRLTFVHSSIPWVVAVVMACFALLTFASSRVPPLMRSIGAGAAIGIVATSFLLTDFRQSQTSRDLAINYAQDQLELVCADSILNHQRTGKFLDANQSVGLFQLDTAEISSTQATYTLTGKELPGKVVCNVGTSGGDLTWEYGKMVSERVRLLSGTVHNTEGRVTLRIADGRNYPLELANGGQHVYPGAYVLGAEDPKTLAVRPVRVMSVGSQTGLSLAVAPTRAPNN